MTGADEEEELDTGSFYISRKLNNMFLQDQENVIMLNLKTDDFENLFSSLTSKAPLIIAFTNDEDQLIYSNKPLTKTQTAALKQQKVNYDHRNWLCFSQTLEHYPLTVPCTAVCVLCDRPYGHFPVYGSSLLSVMLHPGICHV